ncbi:PLDc N-terminal domain-containing protein [Pseudarthrobacter sp. H2]|uniref:PLDc N-terminal domain-containing protein n=1 Tax=Pseudarthrobacter sp. H2 TaxID=3418415 RepID=UPI003CFA66FD
MANRSKKSTHKKKSWKELSPMARFGTVAAAIVQLSLLIAAQRDISRRPAEQIRGSKAVWRAVTLINFIGPGSYFAFGRKNLPGTR